MSIINVTFGQMEYPYCHHIWGRDVCYLNDMPSRY